VTTVLLADDQPLLRKGFRMILEEQPDITVIGEAANGEEAVRQVRQWAPEVVLMDVRMPEMDGIEATRRIVSERLASRVLILTTFDLDEYVFGAVRAGASGFLLKDARPAELVGAVRTVARGDAIVAPRATRLLLETYLSVLPPAPGDGEPRAGETALFAELTEREREVLLAMADGLSNAEIAERLYVSETTVKSHVGRILAKLGLRDRVQAVVLAYQTGLVRPGGAS